MNKYEDLRELFPSMLYRWHEAEDRPRPQLGLYWCEGEKDADAAWEAGGGATSHWQGAGNATEAQALRFADSEVPVYVVADLDPAGAYCALRRYRLLRPVLVARRCLPVPRVRVVRPVIGNDLSDHLAAGYALEDLVPVDMERMKVAAASFEADGKRYG